MGKSGTIFGKLSLNSGKLSPDCAARAVDWLRREHPARPAEEIEAATGGRVAAQAARKWLAGVSAPSFLATLALIEAYGPEFLAAVLPSPPAWLRNAERSERLAALERRRADLDRAITALNRD